MVGHFRTNRSYRIRSGRGCILPLSGRIYSRGGTQGKQSPIKPGRFRIARQGMREYRIQFFSLTLALFFLGCGERQSVQSPSENEEWKVAAEPAVMIGGSDEREGYLLQRVTDATRLNDGRIVIADEGSSEISFYDSLGTHLATVGGEGEGPGEFRRIMQMQRLPGDTLLVLSRQPGLTWLSPQGEYLRSKRVSLNQVASLPCRISEGNWQLLPDGSLLTILGDNFAPTDCGPEPPSPYRESGLIVRSTSLDGTFDTLGIFPATERNTPNYRAYGRLLALAVGPNRVYAGDTGAREIPALDFQGDTLLVYSTPWEAVPIPDQAKRDDVRRFEYPDGTVYVGNAYIYPEHYPLFGRLLADRVGYLWVMSYPVLSEPISSWRLEKAYSFLVGEGGAQWRVLGPKGQLITELRTPSGLFPLEIGEDFVLGVSKDDLDVQAVQLHALVR